MWAAAERGILLCDPGRRRYHHHRTIIVDTRRCTYTHLGGMLWEDDNSTSSKFVRICIYILILINNAAMML